MNELTKFKHTQLIYGGICFIDEDDFYELKRYLDKCSEKYSYEYIKGKYKVVLD